MENIHFKSEALLVPLKQEYCISASWLWADNQIKEWYNQQFNNCSAVSFSDQLLFFYSRVNIVDKAKYVEHRHTKKPKQQIKTKLVAPYPQGRAAVCSLATSLGYERNSCKDKLLWERSAAHHRQGALPGWAGRVGIAGVTSFHAGNEGQRDQLLVG